MRIHAIDGLRAIAMTMVVAQHCGLLPFGWTGVWLFFVISGYVITQGFVSESYVGTTVGGSYLNFMGRRAVRIVPVYVLYLLTCLLAVWLAGEPAPVGDLGYLASFTYNWQMIFGWWPGVSSFAPFGHLWTLSIEQQFYVFFGLFALLLPARQQVAVSLVIIAAGPVIRWTWSQMLGQALIDEPGRHAFSVYAATHCHIDALLIGSVIARLEPALKNRPRAVTAASVVAVVAALSYAVVYVSINGDLGAQGSAVFRNVFSGILYGQQREVFVYVAVNLVAAAVLVHVLLGRPGTRLLGFPALAWVGRVSYGGYLFHALVLWIAGHVLFGVAPKQLPVLERIVVFAMLWSITVAIASASFVWFEKPFAKRWSPKRAGRAPSPSEPDTTVDALEGSSMRDVAPTG